MTETSWKPMKETNPVTHPRTPFKLGQPVDDVIYVLRRTRRRRLAMEFTGREGTFLFDLRRSNRKRKVEQELAGHKVDMTQNFTVRYFLLDCTLSFKKYRGLDNAGASCYRIISIDDSADLDELLAGQSIVHTPVLATGPVAT